MRALILAKPIGAGFHRWRAAIARDGMNITVGEREVGERLHGGNLRVDLKAAQAKLAVMVRRQWHGHLVHALSGEKILQGNPARALARFDRTHAVEETI